MVQRQPRAAREGWAAIPPGRLTSRSTGPLARFRSPRPVNVRVRQLIEWRGGSCFRRRCFPFSVFRRMAKSIAWPKLGESWPPSSRLVTPIASSVCPAPAIQVRDRLACAKVYLAQAPGIPRGPNTEDGQKIPPRCWTPSRFGNMEQLPRPGRRRDQDVASAKVSGRAGLRRLRQTLAQQWSDDEHRIAVGKEVLAVASEGVGAHQIGAALLFEQPTD